MFFKWGVQSVYSVPVVRSIPRRDGARVLTEGRWCLAPVRSPQSRRAPAGDEAMVRGVPLRAPLRASPRASLGALSSWPGLRVPTEQTPPSPPVPLPPQPPWTAMSCDLDRRGDSPGPGCGPWPCTSPASASTTTRPKDRHCWAHPGRPPQGGYTDEGKHCLFSKAGPRIGKSTLH